MVYLALLLLGCGFALNHYFHFHRADLVATFRKRIVAQSRMKGEEFYPNNLLPGHFTMLYKFWRPLTSYLPKGYDMESINNILREAEGKEDIRSRLKDNPEFKNLLD